MRDLSFVDIVLVGRYRLSEVSGPISGIADCEEVAAGKQARCQKIRHKEMVNNNVGVL